jgi:hypothetical protein
MTIHVGDTVRIVEPVFFVRCGYPLTLKDGKKAVEGLELEIKEFLQYLVAKANKDPLAQYPLGPGRGGGPRVLDRSVHLVRAQVAYEYLRLKRFGGDHRKLYTETWEPGRGMEFGVERKFVVQSGYRNPGTKPGWVGISYYDHGEGPSFEPEGTHVILEGHWPGERPGDPEFLSLRSGYTTFRPYNPDWWGEGPLRIEQTNVEKTS